MVAAIRRVSFGQIRNMLRLYMKSGAGGLFWKQQMGMLFTGVRDHLDLLKVGLKDAPNGAVSQLYQQVSLPVLGLFF